MINEQPIYFQVDAGADVIVVLPGLFYSLKRAPVLKNASRLLMGPCKQKLSCPGTFIAELQVKDTIAKKRVYGIEDLERPLLAREEAEHYELISRLDSLGSDDLEALLPYHTQRRR